MAQRLLTISSLVLLTALLSGCWVDLGHQAGDDLDDSSAHPDGVVGDGGLPGTHDPSDPDGNPGSGAQAGLPTGGANSYEPTDPAGAGGTAAGSGGNYAVVPGQPTLPSGRGATVPFVTYEAEDMTTNGAQLGPTRAFGQVPAEASGRRAVRLSAQGHEVAFSNESPSNSIVVRYSIPDGGL